MWVVFAFGSALCAGVTAVLAKCGIKNTDSNVATAIRTIIVLFFSWSIVFLTGKQCELFSITKKTWIFLVFSGISSGCSWLCYFKAIQLGDINKVTPIDKASTILTMMFAFLFLNEEITWLKAGAILCITCGTYFMLEKKQGQKEKINSGSAWLTYAVVSCFFASLTSILGKVGIEGVDSNLGTAIRTSVVLIMAWIVVFITKKQHTIKLIDKKSWLFLTLSGLATGASWICYYRALQEGPASVVVPIDKLSIVITIMFSYIVLKEKLSKKAAIGLILIVSGTFSLLL